MTDFVQNKDSLYADKFKEEDGEICMVNTSLLLSHNCIESSFSQLSSLAQKNYLASQVVDAIRLVYVNHEASGAKEILTGYPDGHLYLTTASNVTSFYEQTLDCLQSADPSSY